MQEKNPKNSSPPPIAPVQVAIIGGGPAGLRAAEVALAQGLHVALFDQKPSPGRKFLLAGKGGLNISNAMPADAFAAQYKGGRAPLWKSMLADFTLEDLRAWAQDLGVETFIGTSNRLFPRDKYAAPLLRRWLHRLRTWGLHVYTRHKLLSLQRLTKASNAHPTWRLTLGVATPEAAAPEAQPASAQSVVCEALSVILALGGGSYPETGSDGSWVNMLLQQGIATQPLAPANCGWEVDWPTPLPSAVEGQPLKNIAAHAGDPAHARAGELLLTRYGIEGGLIYQLGNELRMRQCNAGKAALYLDLKPARSAEELVALWKGSADEVVTLDSRLWPRLEKAWKLSRAHISILKAVALGNSCLPDTLYSSKAEDHSPKQPPESISRQKLPCTLQPPWTIRDLSALAKALPVPLTRPRPIEEAISSAGGVCWDGVTDELMLAASPGLFFAGEMLDWEAPTGGFLLHGALATGTRAGKSAACFCKDLMA
ncbi:aminoacetone oxidase family FAD-binding enzyme [Verrucomicrobia bacterium LW23]|nr:aminoacetone oxidase family FAD-binding enzyme [Verrucomicrobia bacterium LW23]